MFNIFNRLAQEQRNGLRSDYERVMNALTEADDVCQVCVGHMINTTNTLFFHKFGSIDNFQKLSKHEKYDYLNSLTKFEENFHQKKQVEGLGVALFKMWVGAIVADDRELYEEFSQGLIFLSKKAP